MRVTRVTCDEDSICDRVRLRNTLSHCNVCTREPLIPCFRRRMVRIRTTTLTDIDRPPINVADGVDTERPQDLLGLLHDLLRTHARLIQPRGLRVHDIRVFELDIEPEEI